MTLFVALALTAIGTLGLLALMVALILYEVRVCRDERRECCERRCGQ